MSQNSTVLPTTGTISGLQEQTLINAALDTLNTKWSGASAPATPAFGQSWLDTSTTPNTVRIYDGAQWVAVGTLDATNHAWNPLPAAAAASAPPSPFSHQLWWDTSTTPATLRVYDGASWVAVGTLDSVGHAWASAPALATGISVNTTLTAADVGKTFTSGAANITASLPAMTAVPDGSEYGFQCQNPTFTIAANGSEKIYGPDGWGVSSLGLTQVGASIRVKREGATGWLVVSSAAASLGSPIQSRQDVTGSRALGSVYTNSTGRAIEVTLGVYNTSGGELEIMTGGVTVGYAGGATGIRDIISFTVKAGDTYEVAINAGAFSLTSWSELR